MAEQITPSGQQATCRTVE